VREVSLITAVKHGDAIAVRQALDQRAADIHEKDSQGWTPLFHAAHKGDLHILQLLIRAGADVNHGSETGFTALFSAVLGGHVEVVKELLGSGAKQAPVQGIALRGYAPNAQIRTLLDNSN
jgi:ankyrin repeat protein